MPPKKKEEEPPPPDELLAQQAPGFSIGGEVYWTFSSATLASGILVKPGFKGTLEALCDLAEENTIDLVLVRFEEVEEPQSVPLASLSVSPPPLDLLDNLSTGLFLPLTGKDVEQIWAIPEGNYEKQGELIMQKLGLKERYGTGRREIVCDYHLYNLVHTKSLCLSTVQGSVFLAIMDQMLSLMRDPNATPKAKPSELCSAEQCFQSFKELLLAHCRSEPPARLDIFKDSEAKLLTDFATVTLFKHYLLYQYCINFDREIETLRFHPYVERPCAPPDLKVAALAHRERKKQEAEARDHRDHHGDRDHQQQEGTALEETKGGGEDQEIERLVLEKLKETEAKLEARLAQREEEFIQRLEAKKKGK